MSGVSFVSETELDEVRVKRQEEWEKVRKADDPLERPEEEIKDNRTLYERLEEQKQKKQDEWDEQHKLKNMVRGLDSDETVFLDMVSKQQEDLLSRRFNEETQEIREYRNAVSQLQSTVPIVVPTESKTLSSAVSNRKSSQDSAKKSQLQLIAGSIKRKSSSSSGPLSSPEKKSRIGEEAEEDARVDNIGTVTDKEEKRRSQEEALSWKRKTDNEQIINTDLVHKTVQRQENITNKRVTGIPGLGAYSDSSDSESSSSESDTLATHDLFKLS